MQSRQHDVPGYLGDLTGNGSSSMRTRLVIESPKASQARDCSMKSASRFYVLVTSTRVANIFLGVPSFAQLDEAAALSARVNELYRAGKYSEATPLA
jgi:hypothetical protein